MSSYYTVRGTAEEFDCPWCGAPIYHGDRAYLPDEASPPYCSRRCHEQDQFDSGYGNGGTLSTAADSDTTGE